MKKLLTTLLIMGCSLGLVACKTESKKVELQVPTELVVENQYISFNEVENASYYNIYYDGNTWTILPSYTGEVIVDASKIFTEIKTYEVKVKAIGTGNYLDSGYSESVYYERTENLGIPSIKLNQETLTWSLINNATNYTIKVTFPDKTVGYYTYTSNTFDIRTILDEVGTYTFQVKAGANNYGEYSATATYVYNKKLSTPSNLSISYNRNEEEIYLYFLADAETVSYTLNVNDVNYELTDSLLDKYSTNNGFSNYKKIKLLSFLKMQNSTFANVKNYNVCVTANAPSSANYTNSDTSSKVSINLFDLLSSPTIKLASTSSSQSTLSWNKINGATSYAIYLNYEFYTNVEPDNTSLIFENSTLENKIITVQAIGVDGKQSSPNSNAVYLAGMTTFEAGRCSISDTILTFDDTIDKYFIELYNEETYQTITVEDNYSDLDLKQFIDYGKYTLRISCYEEGYNPQVTTQTLNYTKQLSTVTINSVGSSHSMYTLHLAKNEDAVGYAVKINEKLVDKLFTTTNIDLTKYISTAGNYSIKVQAVADPTKNISSSDWSEAYTIQHRQQLDKPELEIIYDDNTYTLFFPRVDGAYSYTILINYIPIYDEDVEYQEKGYDLTTYLTTAQEYTILVKANANPSSGYYTDSDYASKPVRKYIQLDTINADSMIIINQDGKYWLNFTSQTFAASYNIRIYHLEDENEQIVNVQSVPCDITKYVQDSGTYKIYITAVADTENAYYYLSSNESGNPYVLEKDRPTLGLVSGFVVDQKVSGQDKLNASWDNLENAEKYYLTISYVNNYAKNPNVKLIDEVYVTSNSIDLAQFLSREGQYTIKIKGVSDGKYESTSFATFTYNYHMTVDSDFKRNQVIFNGNTISHYVTSYSQLTNLIHYYYLYNNINYFDENLNCDYKLKFMLAPNITIDMLNAECEELNSGFTNEATNDLGETISNVVRMQKLAEVAINSYSERVYFSTENPFGAPSYYNDSTTSYYIYNYETGLSNTKTTLEYKGNALFENTYSTIASQLRRNDNYIFKLELKNKVDVSSTEQLFMAVQAGYAPNFVGDYSVAKTVYDNAKLILNTICTDEMTDYDKVVAIYTWLISNVNYNYQFDELMTTSSSLGSYTDASNTLRIGNANYNYLEAVFLNSDSRIAVSNGISKAFVLMCALEGIESVKVNGTKDGKYYYWNKVYLDCSPNDDEEIKAWYVVDVSGAYQTTSLQDDPTTTDLITYNIGSYQYFLVSDNYIVEKLGVVEKYNLRNATSVFNDTTEVKSAHNYYASTSYSYSKTLLTSDSTGLHQVTYSGNGILKYTESAGGVEDYLKDILSYMACNAKSGNKYLLEIDLSASSANQLDLIGKIQVNYYDEVRNKFNTSFVISATSLNNKILIAISCN